MTSFAARLRRLEFRLSSEWRKYTRRPVQAWPNSALLSYIREHTVVGSEDHLTEFVGRLSDDELEEFQQVLLSSLNE